MNLLTRFNESYTPITESGCWLWDKQILPSGYGNLWVDGHNQRAHRVSWMLYKGSIPEGLCVCHKCDVPCCVNPSHLFLGTQADNLLDAANKGRINKPNQYRPHKFTTEQVNAIRKLLSESVSQRRVAKLFNTTHPTISDIAYGRTYK